MSDVVDGELLGKTPGALVLQGPRTEADLTLEPTAWRTFLDRLEASQRGSLRPRAHLRLENILGTHDASVLNVGLRVVDPGAAPALDLHVVSVGSIGLYGLRRASSTLGASPARGLHHVLDVTAAIENLDVDALARATALVVSIETAAAVPVGSSLSIGQVRLVVDLPGPP